MQRMARKCHRQAISERTAIVPRSLPERGTLRRDRHWLLPLRLRRGWPAESSVFVPPKKPITSARQSRNSELPAAVDHEILEPSRARVLKAGLQPRVRKVGLKIA